MLREFKSQIGKKEESILNVTNKKNQQNNKKQNKTKQKQANVGD